MNVVAMVGRAGRDAEIKYVGDNGTAKTSFNLAVDRPGRRGGDAGEGATDWFRVEFWGKTAQIAADYVKKGSLVGISGRIEIQKWKDHNTGNWREMPVIVGDNLRLLGKKSDSADEQMNTDEVEP